MEYAEYTRALGALAVVVGLIWLTGLGMRRFGVDKTLRGITGQQGKALAVMDALYLDPRRKLVLVRAGSQEYLLLIAPDHITVVDKREAHEKPAS